MKPVYLIFYKPYGVLSQFSQDFDGQSTLKDFLKDIPVDAYPVGRLDKDSEGLLLISNDKSLPSELLESGSGIEKEYFVQVEGLISEQAISMLARGIAIRFNKKWYTTLPAQVNKIAEPSLPPRNPPVRYRKNIPTSWISIRITEGKNRQIRRMCAAAGFPVLRLIRVRVGNIPLKNLLPGKTRKVKKSDIL
ncbi:MAG TPA: pseudouridine synthase [Saprospiraceae bacterium]|nr:pseudouridine synthase [Saprospiraceae bacterium]